MFEDIAWPLKFQIIAKCPITKARSSILSLPHYDACKTPMFMHVATQGVMKGVYPWQLEQLDCHVILGNTYHLALKPGMELLQHPYDGLHSFMKWNRGMLTDSGGFQMVSLAKLMTSDEQGVSFVSHFDGVTRIELSPEKSMHIQNAIGSDIMMQLDDVVSSLTTGPRVEDAMWRSIRWLDRCIEAHQKKDKQNLFPIVQGGLDADLRRVCAQEMMKRNCPGYAIGGLSGGESKDEFWKVVSLCTDILPQDKPRYCMGVGYAEDLVVCSALGVDMYDCVFPTRTARFGNALTRRGAFDLHKKHFMQDFTPIEEGCVCVACRNHTKSHIHHMLCTNNTVACHLISMHNIAFQMRLMKDIRTHIENKTFVEFVQRFMYQFYKERIPREYGGHRFGGACGVEKKKKRKRAVDEQEEMMDPGKQFTEEGYPVWIVNALRSVGIELL